MHEVEWVGWKNDDLLAVYKGRGKNGHLGAGYLRKSLVTFLRFQCTRAGGKFTGIAIHRVQTQPSFKSQCRRWAPDVSPLYSLSIGVRLVAAPNGNGTL